MVDIITTVSQCFLKSSIFFIQIFNIFYTNLQYYFTQIFSYQKHIEFTSTFNISLENVADQETVTIELAGSDVDLMINRL